jgi:2-C-methyl-D-erythritol 4-phosphate cytidylyltransferase
LPPDVGVVVVAAGRGTRLGGGTPKQFLPLAGLPLVVHSLRAFLDRPDVAQVALVLPPGAAAAPPAWLAPLSGARLAVVAGGAERMDSVAAGLAALVPACRVVLVHDGARPFVERATVDAVVAAARNGEGALAAAPMTDTVKEADDGGDRVARTLPRARLWRAQTPQGFPRDLLEAAHAEARRTGRVGTDDAELVELLGATVRLVPDTPRNLKITTPEDLVLAECLAAGR